MAAILTSSSVFISGPSETSSSTVAGSLVVLPLTAASSVGFSSTSSCWGSSAVSCGSSAIGS